MRAPRALLLAALTLASPPVAATAGETVHEQVIEQPGQGSPVRLRLHLAAGRPGGGERLAREAAFGLAWLVERWGPSPRPILEIVVPSPGATACPGLVAATAPGGPLREAEELLFRALAHQWWEGLLAADATVEPLLDRGLGTYTAARLLGDRFGGRPAGVRIGGLVVPLPLAPLDPFAAVRARVAAVDPVGPLTCDAAALALAEIESRLGRADFDRAVALFARRHHTSPPRPGDFVRALGAVTGEDLSRLWGELASRPGLSDVGIALATSRADPARPGVQLGEVTVVRRGGPRLPVTIELLFADGARRRLEWDGGDDWIRVRSEGVRLVAARLDPDRSSLLARNRLDDARLVDPDPRPRRQFTQRLRFVAQLLLEALADLA